MRRGAAKCKKTLFFNRKNLSPFQQNNFVWHNVPHFSAMPHTDRILGNQIIVLMISLYPQNCKRQRREPFLIIGKFLVLSPQKPHIPADHNKIIWRQFKRKPHSLFFRKPPKFPVAVTGQVNHPVLLSQL